MAENKDIREDQMTPVSGVDYLRGLVGNNSVLISPDNLLREMFKERGFVSDVNKAVRLGIYGGNAIENAPSSDYAVVAVLTERLYILQFFFPLNSNLIYYRRSINNGTSWYNWTLINKV